MTISRTASRKTICFTATLLALGSLAACQFGEDTMLTACEDVLHDRLKAPSTYKRVTFERYKPTSLDTAEYRDWAGRTAVHSEKQQNFVLERLQAGDKIYHHLARLEYDAANAFGTATREAAACEFTTFVENNPTPKRTDIAVDGVSAVEWIRLAR